MYLQGPAGSVTVHHCRMIHGSKPNTNPQRSRPLLLNGFSSADALPVTPHYNAALHRGEIVRGKRTRWIHFDPRPCLMPPDWSGGYTSIFAIQQGEERSGPAADERLGESRAPGRRLTCRGLCAVTKSTVQRGGILTWPE